MLETLTVLRLLTHVKVSVGASLRMTNLNFQCGYYLSRWKGPFCKQNKLAKSANSVSKFKAKHAIEEQSQCLEGSEVLKAKLVDGFDLLT